MLLASIRSLWCTNKYFPDGYLYPHVDGTCDNQQETSIYTINIYLNHNLKGGETVFLDDNDGSIMSITPKAGRAIIFRQDLRHQGNVVTNGFKYILRSDLMKNRF